MSPVYSSSASLPVGSLGRKRSSVDLGANYPGDLLLRERQKKQLIKRNTIADFAATRSYHASTTSLISEQGSVSQGTPNQTLLSSSFVCVRVLFTRSWLKDSSCVHQHLDPYALINICIK